MDEIIRLCVYLTVISVAGERAVDIIKRALQKLNYLENINGALWQLLAGIFGAVVVYVDQPQFTFLTTNRWLLIGMLGLAASGGSGAWNTVLSILKELSIPKTSDTK